MAVASQGRCKYIPVQRKPPCFRQPWETTAMPGPFIILPFKLSRCHPAVLLDGDTGVC